MSPASGQHVTSLTSRSGVPSSHMDPASNENLISLTSKSNVDSISNEHQNSPTPREHQNSPTPREHLLSPTPREHQNSPTSKEHRTSPISREHRNSPISREHRNSPTARENLNSPTSREHLNSPTRKEHPTGPIAILGDKAGNLPALTIESYGSIQSSMDRGQMLDPAKDTLGTWDDITICQLQSSSMLRITVYLQGILIKAVVDTAAEVTIISDRIFNELKPKPPCLKKVILRTAGRDLKMKGFVVGLVPLQLGSGTFMEAVYVAPIQDDMLLGLAFLLRHGVDIQLDNRFLHFRETKENVPIEVERSNNKTPSVARVTISKPVKIPPNSVVRLECDNSDELTDYMLEPQRDLSVLIPKTLHSGGVKPKVCMLNLTDSTIRLKQHQLVANTYPVCSIYPVPVDNTGELLESLNPDVINLVKNIKTGVNISLAPNSNCPQTIGTNYKTCSSDVVVEQVDSEKMSPKTID